MYHDIPPWYSNFKGWYPPTVLNTPPPPWYSWYPPTCIMKSPTVMNTLTVLKITPHGTHDIPTLLNTPTVLKISPTVLMISPTVLNIPHGTAYTLYRVICMCQFYPMISLGLERDNQAQTIYTIFRHFFCCQLSTRSLFTVRRQHKVNLLTKDAK